MLQYFLFCLFDVRVFCVQNKTGGLADYIEPENVPDFLGGPCKVLLGLWIMIRFAIDSFGARDVYLRH